MNKRSFVFGVATILFTAVFILASCEQLTGDGNGNGSERDNPFDLDSPLLIEVWDSSTPAKFLGYDTGLRDWRDGNYSLILTSKGYCVSLWNVRYNRDGKRYYGEISDEDQGMSYDDPLAEMIRNNGWGHAVFFDTASDPTANDTPYGLWGGSSIVNNVMFNPHNGGTYYTWDTNAALHDITIRADYKFYDCTGMIRIWNDDVVLGYQLLKGGSSGVIGETWTFRPLKKIGGYAELGLPNPDDVKPPLIYKVTY